MGSQLSESDRAQYHRWLRELSSFKHRGSATAFEAQAANYLFNELQSLGFHPVKETFKGSTSWGRRHLFHVLLAAFGLCFLWYTPLITVVIGLVAVLSFWFEGSSLRQGLTRPFVQSPSTNVVAYVASPTKPRQRIVVSGHFDTQRTGFLWRLTAWLAPFQWKLPVILKPPLQLLAMAMMAQILVGLCAIAGPNVITTVAATLLLTVYIIHGLLFLEWSFAPFVPGAADNASGAVAVLSVAAAWKREPVADVDLVLLLTGSEESGLLGATAWIDSRSVEDRSIPTMFLNIDCVGMGPTRYLGWEVPAVGVPARFPESLLAVAADVAKQQGLTNAGPHAVPGPTDGLAFLKRGIPGLTVVGFQDHGYLPNYHRMSDTADNVDYESSFAGVQFAWAILRRLLTC